MLSAATAEHATGGASSPLQDGRFLVLGALGRGGMSAVLRAFDRVDQRIVALKAPSRRGGDGPAHPLAVEFDHCTRLAHPNVIEVFELGMARRGPIPAGTPYMVMEHVAGRPVHDALAGDRVEPAVLERVAIELLRALAHVHAEGLVHRDLKPGNVLVERTDHGLGKIKLTDFGLSVPAGSAESPGTISGSLPYVSPESLLGLPIDGRADLYGLGVLLFRLAAGRLPVAGRSVDAWVRWHLGGEEADLACLRPDLSRRFRRFVRRLTTRDREERPRSPAAALALLGSRGGTTNHGRARLDGRGDRARIRLALDAARLGGRRCFEIPDEPALRRAMLREVRVWSEVHGLGYHVLDAGRERLARLALRLLCSRDGAAAGLVRHRGLDRILPLRLVSAQPIWDHIARNETETAPPGAARGIALFLLDCAAGGTLVLRVSGAAWSDPLSREIVTTLESRIEADPGPSGKRGGLLLLLDRRARSRGGPN